MLRVGELAGIFRYPVKSMQGERLGRATLGVDGLPGDRAWGLRDERRGDFFLGKRCPELMSCAAAYVDGFEPGAVPEVVLPGGPRFSAGAPDAAERLSAFLGSRVSVWPAGAEARAAESGEPIGEAEMRSMLAREANESLPDFSDPAPELVEFQSRNGPLVDAFPILILTVRSLETIADAQPGMGVDWRRFRPNLLVAGEGSGSFPEQDWVGCRLRVGDAVLSVHSKCIRCAMVTHGFADLPKAPQIMRTLVRENEGTLGVYALVEEPGEIRAGDRVTLLG